MKKQISAVIIGFVLIAVTIFSQYIFVQRRLFEWWVGIYADVDSKPAILYVNGKDIASDDVIIYRDNGPYPNYSEPSYFAQLPFTVVLELIGAEVIWNNDYLADVYLCNEKYSLDLESILPQFTPYDSAENLIPYDRCGGRIINEPQKRELILDFGAVIDIFESMDIVEDVCFDGDYDKGCMSYDIKLK